MGDLTVNTLEQRPMTATKCLTEASTPRVTRQEMTSQPRPRSHRSEQFTHLQSSSGGSRPQLYRACPGAQPNQGLLRESGWAKGPSRRLVAPSGTTEPDRRGGVRLLMASLLFSSTHVHPRGSLYLFPIIILARPAAVHLSFFCWRRERRQGTCLAHDSHPHYTSSSHLTPNLSRRDPPPAPSY